MILRILAIIDQALQTGQSISKRWVIQPDQSEPNIPVESYSSRRPRDIYYIDPAYFRSQNTVNGVIDDLACTIGVDRAAMNIVSPSVTNSKSVRLRRHG